MDMLGLYTDGNFTVEKDLVSLYIASRSFLILRREKAFVSSAFKEYNPRVEFHVDKMIQILLKSNGKEVNVTKTIDNLVFDMCVLPHNYQKLSQTC